MADLGMLGECVDWVLVADGPNIKLGAMYGTDEFTSNFNKFITDPSLPHKMFSASPMAISKVADLPDGQKTLRILMSDGVKEDVSYALLNQLAVQSSSVEHKSWGVGILEGFYTSFKKEDDASKAAAASAASAATTLQVQVQGLQSLQSKTPSAQPTHLSLKLKRKGSVVLAPELPTSDQENEKDETVHEREVSVYSDSGGDSSGDSSARQDSSKEKRKRKRQHSSSSSQSSKSSKRNTSSDGSSSYKRSSPSFNSSSPVTHSKHAILLNPQMTKCEVGKTGFVFKALGKLEEVSDALKKDSNKLEEAIEAGKSALEQARDAVNSTSHSGTSKDGLALEGAILGL
ncbi:hypothetical protein B484DRAFT_462219, partial [Ochromonadaceae sp. CCMP2298]